jgi:hypothetical protein
MSDEFDARRVLGMVAKRIGNCDVHARRYIATESLPIRSGASNIKDRTGSLFGDYGID